MRLKKGLSSWLDVDCKETSSPPCVCRSPAAAGLRQRSASYLPPRGDYRPHAPVSRPLRPRHRAANPDAQGSCGGERWVSLGRPEHKPRLKGPRWLGWGGSLATSSVLPDKTQMWIFTGTLLVWQLIQVGRIVKPSGTICPRSSAPWPRGEGLLLATTTDLRVATGLAGLSPTPET